MSSKVNSLPREPSDTPSPAPLDTVVEALNRIRFGAIQLTVHDGRLVQIDVTERRRFN
ncbi:MAG: YezD family protein [Novosphingobium sp.]